MTPIAGNPDSYPITFTIPDDSDPPAAATFNVANGGLADRTASLANGYKAELADFNALKAINTTSLPDGAFRVVKGYGRFTLDKTLFPTFAEDLPCVVAPTTGTGRWMGGPEANAQYIFTASTPGTNTWFAPPGLKLVDIEIVGAGGGGAGGSGAGAPTSDPVGGGGGGAGARVLVTKQPSPAAQHDVIVGAGGTGSASGVDGGDGVASSVGVHTFGAFAIALGGQGGSKSTTANADANGAAGLAATVPGGQGVTGTQKSLAYSATSFIPSAMVAGGGGFATNETSSNAGGVTAAGSPNAMGKAGGSAGARGTDASRHGGGGGGGGGGGVFDVGGNGGNGGNAILSGTGSNGSVGAAATNNSGAGGGGGGAGGAGSVAGGTGANGGNGGSGLVVIRGRS